MMIMTILMLINGESCLSVNSFLSDFFHSAREDVNCEVKTFLIITTTTTTTTIIIIIILIIIK